MKKVIIVFGVLLIVAALAGAGYWHWRKEQLRAFSESPFGASKALVDIPQGSGPRRVANLLAQAGVVSDAELLYALIRQQELGPKLRAGEYEFQGPLPPKEVLRKLVAGEVKVYRFTVPEGLRVDEIVPIILGAGSNLSQKKVEALLKERAFLQSNNIPTDSAEGFLHPDTYTFTRGANEEAVLRKMIRRTFEEYQKAHASRKTDVQLTLMEALTLASIVEKETGAVQERPRISCVFHNRLKRGMKLQTDPTVLYAMSLLRGSWLNNITKRDLETDHPYNTYTREGLPPGPISSPGAAALQAALAPMDCSDLFFVSRNDGTHIFCPTLDCHNDAVEEWQRQYFRKKRR